MGNGATNRAWTRVTAVRLPALLGLLCALQLFANLGVLDHGWVYFDDDINIVLNPHLTGGTSDTLTWAWTDPTYTRRYMPLAWMMFDALFRAGGLNAVIYHFASWLLAAANAIALMLVIRRFIPRTGHEGRPTGWDDVCAALVAALFSLHPLRAETVGWASALVYQGSMFLAALAMLCAVPANGTPPGRGLRWLGLLLFLCSLLLYPVCIGLPVILIFAAGCARAGDNWNTIGSALAAASRRYSGWLIAVVAICAVNVFAAATSRTFSALNDLQQYPLDARLGRSALMFGHMLSKAIWPGTTSAYYGDLAAAPVAQKSLVPGILLIATLVLIAKPRTRRPTLLFLAVVLAATLPFVGLLDQGQAANDRYAFMLLTVFAVGTAGVLARATTPRARLLVLAGLFIVTAAVLPAYRRALGIWRNTDTLQARVDLVMAERPDIRLGFARPAMNYFMSGHYAESQQRLRLGFARFGAHPELVAAARFIEETRTSLSGISGREPSMPPYAFMHLDLAKKHEAAGHPFAAKAHREYAQQLMRAGAENRQP